MRGSTGRGAATGFVVGLVLDALFFLPRVVAGDTYEIGDPLLALGLPVLVVATALGTALGALVGRAGRKGDDPRSGSRTAAVVVGAVAVIVVAVAGFLVATGLVDA